MKLSEFLKKTRVEITSCGHLDLRPRLYCNDGFNISIQASKGLYCTPRVGDLGVEYTSVELGYPSDLDDLINEYAEESLTTETVFPYVPVNVVDELINKHGGININKTFKL